MTKQTYTVTIARQETFVYEYEVEAINSKNAEKLAFEKHHLEHEENGKLVHAEEWVQDIDCSEDECEDESETV